MGICLLWATWAHEYTAFLNIDWHRTWGNFKRAGVCDFDKSW